MWKEIKYRCFFSSALKSLHSFNRSTDDLTGAKKSLDVLLLEKSRALNAEQTSSKLLPIAPESK